MSELGMPELGCPNCEVPELEVPELEEFEPETAVLNPEPEITLPPAPNPRGLSRSRKNRARA